MQDLRVYKTAGMVIPSPAVFVFVLLLNKPYNNEVSKNGERDSLKAV